MEVAGVDRVPLSVLRMLTTVAATPESGYPTQPIANITYPETLIHARSDTSYLSLLTRPTHLVKPSLLTFGWSLYLRTRWMAKATFWRAKGSWPIEIEADRC